MTNSPRTRKGSASRVLAVLAAMAIAVAMIPLVAGTALADHREPARFAQVVDLADADSNVEAAVYWSQETRRDGSDESTADTVLLGRDDLFADSLSSGPIQCAVGGPLLLTPQDGVAPETQEEMERLEAGSVVIMGGETAISSDVESELQDQGLETERISGPTRIETAQDAAATFFPDADTAIVARAYGDEEDATRAFADSLAAGAAACEAGIPVLLTQQEELTGSLEEYLAGSSIENVIVVGGAGAVSEETVGAIEGLGITTERVSGSNRAATAVAIAEFFFPEAENATLIDGFQENSWASGFPAALFAAENDSPIVLVGGGSADAEGDDTDTEGGRLQEDDGQSGEEECVIPAETLEYLNSIFTEDSVFTLGPFTDECVEDLLAAEFDLDAAPDSPGATASPTATASASPSPTNTALAPATDGPPVTAGPELESCAITSPTSPTNPNVGVVTYDFDEDVTGQAAVPQRFHIYRFDGTSFQANATRIVGDKVLAEFQASQLQNTTVCTVDRGAVADVSGQLNPEGDEAVQTVVQAAGITEAPDLLSIGNFRTDVQGRVLVDFTFDEAVANTAANLNPAGFELILTGGEFRTGQAVFNPNGQDAFSPPQTVVTVQFAGTTTDIPFSQIARGTVESGTVCDAGLANCNPLQAAESANAGNTTEPDLVGARALSSTQVEFDFDQPVSALAGNLFPANFIIYDANGNEEFGDRATRSQTDASIVIVDFFPTTATNNQNVNVGAAGVTVARAVGASVETAAVRATENENQAGLAGFNEEDEVPLQQVGFQAGRTLQPDLVSVTIITDPVSQNPVVRYTFDQSIASFTDGAGADDFVVADFRLYDANNTQFVGAAGAQPCAAIGVGAAGSGQCLRRVSGDNNSIDVQAFATAQVAAAVLGTVNDTLTNNEVVNPAPPATPTGVAVRFPEGDENVTRV